MGPSFHDIADRAFVFSTLIQQYGTLGHIIVQLRHARRTRCLESFVHVQ